MIADAGLRLMSDFSLILAQAHLGECLQIPMQN